MVKFKVGSRVIDRDVGIQGVVTKVHGDDDIDVEYSEGSGIFSSETCVGASDFLALATPAAIKRYDKRVALTESQRRTVRKVLKVLDASVRPFERMAKALGSKRGEAMDDAADSMNRLIRNLVEAYKL